MSMKEFIPTGFAPLADWDYKQRKKDDGHSVEWKLLSDAAKGGDVPAMKLGGSGRWIVHRQSAVDFLASRSADDSQPAVARRRHAPPSQAAVDAGVLSALVAGQQKLAAAAERIAAACELLSKHGPLFEQAAICVNDSGSTTWDERSST